MGRAIVILSTQISLLRLTKTHWKFYKNWLFCKVSRTFTYYVVWHWQPMFISMSSSSWEQGSQRCKYAGGPGVQAGATMSGTSLYGLDSLFWMEKAMVDSASLKILWGSLLWAHALPSWEAMAAHPPPTSSVWECVGNSHFPEAWVVPLSLRGRARRKTRHAYKVWPMRWHEAVPAIAFSRSRDYSGKVEKT